MQIKSLPIQELLQYQALKKQKRVGGLFFSKYGLRPIYALNQLQEHRDSFQLYGYHVHANDNFVAEKDPVYKVFKKADDTSIAVIDYAKGNTLVLFWDKRYYLMFSKGLTQNGFYMAKTVSLPRNVLHFVRQDVSLSVDITVWSDFYKLEIK